MNIIKILTIGLLSTFFISGTFAHTDHHHAKKEASEATVKSNAQKHVERLIGKKKLAANWSKAKLASSEKKQIKGRTEWLVKFENPEVEDTSKKTLYMFLNIYGDFIAANFTGK